MPSNRPPFYDENNTYIAALPDGGSWPQSTPEAQGLNAAALSAGASALAATPSSLSFLVIRHGVLVKEAYFHGSAANQSNNIHSGSKSILSALVGLLLEHGFVKSLDEKLENLLPRIKYAEPAKANIKLRDLLTMSAGFEWVEDETELEIEKKGNWIQAIVDLPLVTPPGEVWHYCTGESHIVSAIIAETTKMSTRAFAETYLLKPLGVTVDHWGHDPQCYNSGGYNFYMTPRALAKFALLMSNGGKLKGQQILPQAWVEESLADQKVAHKGYTYGYYWWLKPIDGVPVRKVWGWGGQFAYLIPSADVIVVITNNTHEVFPEMDGDAFIKKYIVPSISSFTE